MKKANIITIVAVVAVVAILAIQAYLIYANFNSTRDFLTLDAGNILAKAYKNELGHRGFENIERSEGFQNLFEKYEKIAETQSLTQEELMQKMQEDMSAMSEDDLAETLGLDSVKIAELERLEANNDAMGIINVIMNSMFKMPENDYVNNVDSVVRLELAERNIRTDFVVRMVNERNNEVIAQSKPFDSSSKFLIRSNYVPTDFFNEKSLQLILVNPFIAVFQRMGVLVATSLVLALLSFYGLWFLFRTLARQKKLLELKNDFFSNTAHELRRPVVQMNMAVDRLMVPQVSENTQKTARYLSISKNAVTEMSDKITMLMALAMEEEGVFRLNITRFNLSEVIRQLAEQFTATAIKEVNIDFSKVSDNVYINGDETHIRQCIANLIDNAIKYSGNAVDIIISLLQKGEEVLVSVKDNGTGFPPEKAELIFEKYNRLGTEKEKPAGFGIGLSYVKTIIEKHKGKISVNSEEGKGSEFVLQFG